MDLFSGCSKTNSFRNSSCFWSSQGGEGWSLGGTIIFGCLQYTQAIVFCALWMNNMWCLLPTCQNNRKNPVMFNTYRVKSHSSQELGILKGCHSHDPCWRTWRHLKTEQQIHQSSVRHRQMASVVCRAPSKYGSIEGPLALQKQPGNCLLFFRVLCGENLDVFVLAFVISLESWKSIIIVDELEVDIKFYWKMFVISKFFFLPKLQVSDRSSLKLLQPVILSNASSRSACCCRVAKFSTWNSWGKMPETWWSSR